METVLITGGTGFIGTYLTSLLVSQGKSVIILSRQRSVHIHPKVEFAEWDPLAGSIDEEAIKKADHIIHLAGAGVADKRWSAQRKNELVESRTKSAALLVKALKTIPNKVQTVVSASAIGWYGADTPQSLQTGFTEEAAADHHFLGETCRLREESINPVQEAGKRLIKCRIGIVLSDQGGAVAEFSKPIRFGIATIFGSGEQVMSWIHIEDLCRLFIYAIENKQLQGVYNAVAPNPVSNKEFILALAKKLRGKMFIPIHIPSFILKLALGEMSIEVLKSATVSSKKIQQTGFVFHYPSVNAALHLK